MLPVLAHWQVSLAAQKFLRLHDVAAYRLLGKLNVALSAGRELGQHEIVSLHAPADGFRVVMCERGYAHGDEPLLPSGRRLGCLGTNAMRVVAERLVELRAVAHRSVDLDCLLGSCARVHVGLLREEHCVWRVWELTEDRLAADYDDVALARDRGRRPDDMLELVAFHAGASSTAASARRRSGSLRAPAKGELWRRSRMRGVSCPINRAIWEGVRARIF